LTRSFIEAVTYDGWVQGDLLYGTAANTTAKLAKSTTSTHALLNTGTNNNPAWGQVPLTSGVTGILPVANGGTGGSTLASSTTWTPSGTACSPMTISSTSFPIAYFTQVGKIVFWTIRMTTTTGGSAGSCIMATIPTATFVNMQFHGSVAINDGGTWSSGWIDGTGGPNRFVFYKANLAGFAVPSSVEIRGQGFYWVP